MLAPIEARAAMLITLAQDVRHTSSIASMGHNQDMENPAAIMTPFGLRFNERAIVNRGGCGHHALHDIHLNCLNACASLSGLGNFLLALYLCVSVGVK